MHLFARIKLIGTTGIVGPEILQDWRLFRAVILHVAEERSGKCHVFGDGAVSNGATCTKASIWRRSRICRCALSVKTTCMRLRCRSKTRLETRTWPSGAKLREYGRAEWTGGVIAIYEAAKTASERARRGEGPTLIEARTYHAPDHMPRVCGMVGLRTADEIADWKARDSLVVLRSRAVDQGMATEAEFDTIEEEIKAIVADALKFAHRESVSGTGDGDIVHLSRLCGGKGLIIRELAFLPAAADIS